MNVKLLRKVKAYILAEPRRLDMDVVGVIAQGGDAPPCGTVGCIAGWAGLLALTVVPKNPEARVDRMSWIRGQDALHLTDAQANRLFREPSKAGDEVYNMGVAYSASWPARFARRYVRASRPATRAKITAERIDHFIKTKGRE
jgi:hypothetical protein